MHQSVAGFERVLEALAQELVDSTDDELLEVAKDLGMNPAMRGSAAFIGLRYPATHRPADFFQLPVLHPHFRIETKPASNALPAARKRLTERHKRRKPQRGGGESDSE